MGPEFLSQLLLSYKYWILPPANLIFGPIVGLMAGALVRADVLELLPTFLFIVGGAIAGDIMWYWIGYHWGERFTQRFGKYVSITESHVAIAKILFNKYHMRILFLSKVTSGLGFAIVILFTAGLSRVPFNRFLLINVAGEIIWSGSLIAIGFFVSHLIIRVNSVLEWASVIGLMVLVLACLFGIGHYLRKHMSQKYLPDIPKENPDII